jgi:hypothetical protein
MEFMMRCKICSQSVIELSTARIMNKYDIKYFYCDHCQFVQTEQPYWLDEAYQRPINMTDVGILDRNIFDEDRLFDRVFLF